MLLLLIFTYLLAAIPFGLAITTLYGDDTDIRTAGSGNIGATNVARVYGWKMAAPALLLDVGKGLLPVVVARIAWPETGLWFPGLVALVAFIGHCYSVFLEFRGGKGVATAAGGMLALSPVPTLFAAATWVAVLAAFGRSSVAALSAALALIGFTVWFDATALPVVVLLALGIAWTHVANIRRLMRGEEKQVIRPVRWGKAAAQETVSVLEQDPGGGAASSPLWKEPIADPLVPTEVEEER